MAKGYKTGRTKVEDGETLYEWQQEDGLEWRRADGTIYKMSEMFRARTQLTPERGTELANNRWDAMREAAVQGLVEAMSERRPGRMVNTSVDAYKELIKTVVEMADSPELAMAAVKSFQNLRQAMGMDERQQQAVAAVQVNINFSDRAVKGFDEDIEVIEAAFNSE